MNTTFLAITIIVGMTGFTIISQTFDTTSSMKYSFSVDSDITCVDKICYDTSNNSPCYNQELNNYALCSPEDSIQFYEYKGKEWMETKKQEMIATMRNNTFHEWIDKTKTDYSHLNVYQYYSYAEDLTKYIIYPSPQKQLNQGTSAQSIICKNNLILILKYDGSPACVKPETRAKLIERGWAMSDQVGEKESISLIKKQYLYLQDFPSDDLPPKIILVEKSNEGWYVIFETLGSGIPIIEAKCFFVDNLRSVTLIGEYEPKIGDMQTNISFKTCS